MSSELPATGSTRSRRRFLRAALLGGAALATGTAIVGEASPAQAICRPTIPGCPGYEEEPEPPTPIWQEVGQITIGGILKTYVSAPLSARGTMTWTMSKTRSDTFRAITQTGTEMVSSHTMPWNLDTGVARFGVSQTVDHIQANSTRVTNAITTASTESMSVQTAPPAAGGYNTWENTAFLLMARPLLSIQIFIMNPLRGASSWDGRFYFKFINGGILFPRSAAQLRDDPGTRDFIGPETADAMLNEYPLKPTETSATRLGLSGPRFGPPTAIAPGTVPFGFSRSMTGTTTYASERTRTITTRIKSGFSFSIAGVPIFDFSTTNSFSTSHTDVQERSNSEVMSTNGILSSDLNHLNYIMEDRVWNTLLITDEGPLSAGFTALSGVVTDSGGTPVSGAVVSMPVGGISYEAYTGKDGRYEFRLPGTVKPGEHTVTCAGESRKVSVSPDTTATVNYRRVNAGLARAGSR